jgi:hypothetical protein
MALNPASVESLGPRHAEVTATPGRKTRIKTTNIRQKLQISRKATLTVSQLKNIFYSSQPIEILGKQKQKGLS